MDGSAPRRLPETEPISSEQIVRMAAHLLRWTISMAMDRECPWGSIFRVAAEMFSDGNIGWGQIAALCGSASNLVLQTLCTRLTRTIVGWVLDFIQERLLGWIQEQSGWDGLLSYFSTAWQVVAILSATVLMASFIVQRRMAE
ncbi:apoptosis regulator BAX-like [Erinaceus europaeus]|uniref:Apoptosis regulator BAX-like n=1 Tax=Erinaceus europaeus TaxID=9365 RepID=A0ABM3WUZ4_ERIEU|nr:apoptosis regulator BAX-like [Erinaceus europaeus]